MLIKLTNAAGHPTFVNPRAVAALQPTSTLDDTHIILTGSQHIMVRGRVEDVAALLDQEIDQLP